MLWPVRFSSLLSVASGAGYVNKKAGDKKTCNPDGLQVNPSQMRHQT